MSNLATSASVSFQIGNVELTNLIVQDQVTKVQAEIDALQAEIEANFVRIEEIEKALSARVQTLAEEKWADKIKKLACLLWEFGFAHLDVDDDQTPEDAFDEYDLKFHYDKNVIFLTRSLYDRPWTEADVENPQAELMVGFEITKTWTVGGSTRGTHVHLPLQERSSYERVPVTLPEDSLDLIREARRTNLANHELCKQRDDLKAKIEDTGPIEKKVLAALTQKTLTLNPELMNQIGDIVGIVEGSLPLLTASDAS